MLFRIGGKTPDPKMQVRTYMDVMKEQHLSKEEVKILEGFTLEMDFLKYKYVCMKMLVNFWLNIMCVCYRERSGCRW